LLFLVVLFIVVVLAENDDDFLRCYSGFMRLVASFKMDIDRS
jgi:hypothetical protein